MTLMSSVPVLATRALPPIGMDELARLAAIAQPKKLVLYHGLFYGTEESTVLNEIQALYNGDVVLANDLDVFTVD